MFLTNAYPVTAKHLQSELRRMLKHQQAKLPGKKPFFSRFLLNPVPFTPKHTHMTPATPRYLPYPPLAHGCAKGTLFFGFFCAFLRFFNVFFFVSHPIPFHSTSNTSATFRYPS